MIAAHSSGGNTVLPFGNFGAALFFFCSGMNTILFLQRAENHIRAVAYHIFFVLLLFLGGYTQIIIVHRQVNRFVPEFLQFNALGIFFIFLLFKLFKRSSFIGYCFPLPFIFHFLYQSGYLSFIPHDTCWRPFVFGESCFPLFPWAGFLLFGIFMLNIRKRSRVMNGFSLTLFVLSAVSIWIFKVPIRRINMSLSYTLLALSVLAFLFVVFHQTRRLEKWELPESAHRQLALVGRNSLMFVYLHYFILRYLVPGIPESSDIVELVFQALVAFVICCFFIFIYEKIKFDMSLFIPVILTVAVMVVFRYVMFF